MERSQRFSVLSFDPKFEGNYTETARLASPTTPSSEAQKISTTIYLSKNMDMSKFKTRICKNFKNRTLCRFGDNCAFLHIDEDIQHMTMKEPTLAQRTMPAKSLSYEASCLSQGEEKEMMSESSDTTGCTGSPVSPPQYEEAVRETRNKRTDSVDNVAMPPAYPTRFRYDPYSETGIQYITC